MSDFERYESGQRILTVDQEKVYDFLAQPDKFPKQMFLEGWVDAGLLKDCAERLDFEVALFVFKDKRRLMVKGDEDSVEVVENVLREFGKVELASHFHTHYLTIKDGKKSVLKAPSGLDWKAIPYHGYDTYLVTYDELLQFSAGGDFEEHFVDLLIEYHDLDPSLLEFDDDDVEKFGLQLGVSKERVLEGAEYLPMVKRALWYGEVTGNMNDDEWEDFCVFVRSKLAVPDNKEKYGGAFVSLVDDEKVNLVLNP